MSLDSDHYIALARRREEEISQGIRPTSTNLVPVNNGNGEPTNVESADPIESTEPGTPQEPTNVTPPHDHHDQTPTEPVDNDVEEKHFLARQALQTIKAECRARGIEGLTLSGRDASSPEVQALATWFMVYMYDHSEVRKGKRVFTKGSIHALTALDPTIIANRAQPLKTGIMLILEDMGMVYRRWPQDRTVELLMGPDTDLAQRERGQRSHQAKEPARRAKPDPVQQLVAASKYGNKINREIIAADMGAASPPHRPAPPVPAAPRQWPVNFPFLGEQLTVVGFHLDSGRVRVDFARPDGSATRMWLDKEDSSVS